MRFNLRHPWNVSLEEARAIQEQLRQDVIREDRLGPVSRVAGVDVGLEDTHARAAIAVLSLPDLALQDYAIARRGVSFPYIPGFLSFREIPAVLDALEKLSTLPDLLLCDGQGIAHPRRLGIASHLGVLIDFPTIGVAKTLLVGHHPPVPNERGDWVPLVDKGEVIGAVLRTRVDVKPVYISSGHRVSLKSAIGYVMQCTTKYRLPETTRWAHRLASRTGKPPAARP
jgi:deoxyribonuclease V